MKKLFIITLALGLAIAFTSLTWGKDGCTTIKDGTIEYGRAGDPSTEIIPIGYDQWGYNYQAHLFNGWYWNSQRPDPPYTDEQSLIDAGKSTTWLIMKWSDEWLSNKDCNGDRKLDRGYSCDPDNASSSNCQGAWVTNHQLGSYLGNWQLVGDWVIAFDFGSPYVHDMSITEMTGNSFSGIGGYPSETLYSHPWTVTGTVNGDDVELEIVYGEGAPNTGYTVYMAGSISQDGSMSGTCTTSTHQECTWVSTSGEATGETCEWDYFVKIVHPGDDAYKDGGMWYTADGELIGSVIWGAYARVLQISNDPCAGETGVENKWETPAGFGYYK